MVRFERRPLQHFMLWWGIGIALLGTVCYESLTPTPIPSPDFDGGDKLGHFLVYFTLTSWFVQLYGRSAHRYLAAAFIALGVVLEWLQGMTGYRMFEYADMLANSGGVALAWGLAATSYAGLLLCIERYLQRR